MSAAELVQCSGMTEHDVSQLLQGKKEITLDVATKHRMSSY